MPHTPRRCDPTVDSTPTDPGVSLIIELVDTADMPDGQPLPPYIDGDVVWHVVRRADARTCWRRIRLSSETLEHAIDCRPVARAFNTAAATRKK